MSKPFNLADAKAGHPVAIANAIPGAAGLNNAVPAKILSTEINSRWCVVVAYHRDREENIVQFLADGTNFIGCVVLNTRAHLVMAPIGTIDGKPVYPGDVITVSGVSIKAQHGDAIYWANAKWPRKYPETQMNNEEVRKALHNAVQHIDVANAVIRHGIDNGYLLDPMEQTNISIQPHDIAPEDLERMVAAHTPKGEYVLVQPPFAMLSQIAQHLKINTSQTLPMILEQLKARERGIAQVGIDAGWRKNCEALGCLVGVPPYLPDTYLDALLAKVK